ncbi:hypothetical protein BST61_g3836 [Cercospora zeina]
MAGNIVDRSSVAPVNIVPPRLFSLYSTTVEIELIRIFGKCGVVSWFVLGSEPVLATILRYSMVTMPHPLALVLKLHLLFNLFTYAFATFLSDLDAGFSPWIIALHVLLSPVLGYAAGIIGLLALIYAVVRPISPNKFDIVKKGERGCLIL